MANAQTVHDVTYDLLRSLGLTTVFGNPGSTEQTFLQRFPDDRTIAYGGKDVRGWARIIIPFGNQPAVPLAY